MSPPKPATQIIVKQQEQVLNDLPFHDQQDFDDAARGFIGRREQKTVTNTNGDVVWTSRATTSLVKSLQTGA